MVTRDRYGEAVQTCGHGFPSSLILSTRRSRLLRHSPGPDMSRRLNLLVSQAHTDAPTQQANSHPTRTLNAHQRAHRHACRHAHMPHKRQISSPHTPLRFAGGFVPPEQSCFFWPAAAACARGARAPLGSSRARRGGLRAPRTPCRAPLSPMRHAYRIRWLLAHGREGGSQAMPSLRHSALGTVLRRGFSRASAAGPGCGAGCGAVVHKTAPARLA